MSKVHNLRMAKAHRKAIRRQEDQEFCDWQISRVQNLSAISLVGDDPVIKVINLIGISVVLVLIAMSVLYFFSPIFR